MKSPPAALTLPAISAYPSVEILPSALTLNTLLYDIPALSTVKSFPEAVKLTEPAVALMLTPVVPYKPAVPVTLILLSLPAMLIFEIATVLLVLLNVNPAVAFCVPESLN